LIGFTSVTNRGNNCLRFNMRDFSFLVNDEEHGDTIWMHSMWSRGLLVIVLSLNLQNAGHDR